MLDSSDGYLETRQIFRQHICFMQNVGERFPDEELLQTVLDRMGTYKDL